MKSSVQHIGRIPKFIASNTLGTAVDTIVLWVCSCFIFKRYGYAGVYLVSPLISFECAVFTNYLCSWHFIWNERAKQYRERTFYRKYVVYNLSSTATFLAKMAILLLLERIFGWNVIVCNLVALCISGCINYALGEWVIFRETEKKSNIKAHPL